MSTFNVRCLKCQTPLTRPAAGESLAACPGCGSRVRFKRPASPSAKPKPGDPWGQDVAPAAPAPPPPPVNLFDFDSPPPPVARPVPQPGPKVGREPAEAIRVRCPKCSAVLPDVVGRGEAAVCAGCGCRFTAAVAAQPSTLARPVAPRGGGDVRRAAAGEDAADRLPADDRPRESERDKVTVRIDGPGTFKTQIAGASHYQDAIERAAGGRTRESVELVRPAVLVCDDANPHDRFAVRVEIGGETVGHLSREAARLYRRWLDAAGQGGRSASCRAVILGGWDRGPKDRGHFGVRLDLPPLGETPRVTPAGGRGKPVIALGALARGFLYTAAAILLGACVVGGCLASGSRGQRETDVESVAPAYTPPADAGPAPAAGDAGATTPGKDKSVHVGGYYRKDGTYVPPHNRSAPRR